MSDLISKNALIERVCLNCELRAAKICEKHGDVMGCLADEINSCPIVDAEPVVHARWIDRPTGRYGKEQSWCSACGERSGIGGIISNRHKPRCPNCGAKMDEVGE